MNRRILPVALGLALTAAVPGAQPPGPGLDIYWIDVEGGAATLVVTPERRSILMDAGWARADERDARRIQDAMQDAGVDRIDYFIASHFHGDHVGGLPALAARVPIGQLVDHGDSVEQSTERGLASWNAYIGVAEGRRRTIAPGDKLPSLVWTNSHARGVHRCDRTPRKLVAVATDDSRAYTPLAARVEVHQANDAAVGASIDDGQLAEVLVE